MQKSEVMLTVRKPYTVKSTVKQTIYSEVLSKVDCLAPVLV